ncbi:MAG: hypothetical protein CMM44_03860 [Rhodospirillaceae bacterium]|nr:hypothetical protein [Rhodospirillaceae bacterium]
MSNLRRNILLRFNINPNKGTLAAKIISSIIVTVILLGLPKNNIHAQEIMRIAAVVNSDIITVHDVNERMRIIFTSAKFKPTKSMVKQVGRRVLKVLIDEKLQKQEAKKRNISISKKDFSRAISELEKNNSLRPGTFKNFILAKNINWHAMVTQINAQIIWSKLLRRVIRHKITISDDEVDEKLSNLQRQKGNLEFNLSEILVSERGSQVEGNSKRNAYLIRKNIKKGAKFTAMARQFSDSSSASIGGNIGWFQKETLPEHFKSIVPQMRAGEIAEPIRTIDGYYILKLNEVRRILTSSILDTKIDLRRILFNLSPNRKQNKKPVFFQLAQQIERTTSGCVDFDRAAREAGFRENTKMGLVKIRDLSPIVRQHVRKLKLGRSTPPIRIGDKVALFMICDRRVPKVKPPNRDDIKRTILNERLGMLSRRYIRDLRASAVIDIRI